MNIYKSKAYFILTALALVLLALSLLSIPKIKLGVEFRGGSLAIAELDSPVDVDSLSSELEAVGYASPKITQAKTAFGYRLEVEVPLPEYLVEAEETSDKIGGLLESYGRSARIGERDPALLEEARSLLGKLEELSGLELAKETPADILESSEEALNLLRNKNNQQLESILGKYTQGVFSLQTVTPTLGTSFLEKVRGAALAAAALAAIFVFMIFRELSPSLAVLAGAFSDIVIALGFMGWFGIPLTLGSFAALLMLIGYSLDTDVLLTMRVVKRRDGTKEDRAWDALKTGSTMTLTGLLAFTTLFLVSLVLRIPLYYEIGSVALAGLIGDLVATWGINAVLLLHFAGGRK